MHERWDAWIGQSEHVHDSEARVVGDGSDFIDNDDIRGEAELARYRPIST